LSFLDRVTRRLETAKKQAEVVARRLVDEARKRADEAGLTDRPAGSGPPTPPPPAPLATEQVATSDACVLMGLTGLKMGLEPQGRPLLINHWATWCEGCVAELPLLVELRRRWRGKVDFVGVGWEGFSGLATPQQQVTAVERVAAEHGVDWATMIFEGTAGQLFTGLSLTSHEIPQTLLLNPAGAVLTRHDSVLDGDAINRIEAALRESIGSV